MQTSVLFNTHFIHDEYLNTGEPYTIVVVVVVVDVLSIQFVGTFCFILFFLSLISLLLVVVVKLSKYVKIKKKLRASFPTNVAYTHAQRSTTIGVNKSSAFSVILIY